MSRHTRVILWILITSFAACGGYVGWTLWLIKSHFQWIVWEANGGGLILSHFPGKQQTALDARDAYVPGQELRWRMVEPGGTNYWLGAPTVPPVEELYAQADVFCNAWQSTPGGLIAFYADADERRRMQIACALGLMYRGGDRAAIDEAFATGQYAWLEPIMAACSATPTGPPTGGDIPGDRIKNDVVPDP